ncbi:tRNA (adenosine(37)-N6)-threonylcarbamoyltransferase complex dimerization subunit type 1 TsaB [Shewanella sp. NFH-SH190041]|uniref:tRNA (adenosine(37)-N6)-threonylcarbamoyltransferase complex dimerization subunit type 1 TsaB n=1 Tax=Shewanella sp. NFH-SH190041 TaxID=2950245 RepID=UPI0021C3EBF0|nr:tRNA (adenosine(37)-N6)-threonylcarbamoyltransferase complex dimerization subunit type 1 TsaB [Shewanella sp. NFH-SH190041]BDM64821.1 tRNA (adenosine(37)-N6)-threonylcarbamoyltransferase complex dimerization subunit type 1 TsaB [Shewanella sp. NFH-SH190041]
MPTILALDTCTEACSAALTHQGHIYSAFDEVPREHSQRLLPMVDSLLQQAGIRLTDLDAIAYGRGPGSFTGIRICTSMTQGLALGADKPVVGISTLAAMAQSAISRGATQVLAAIDARMGEVYWGQFIAHDGQAQLIGSEAVSAPQTVALALDASQPIVACGTGFAAYPELLSLAGGLQLDDAARLPDARFMLPLAITARAAGACTTVDDLQPVYLRDTVAWKKLPGRE